MLKLSKAAFLWADPDPDHSKGTQPKIYAVYQQKAITFVNRF